MAVISSGVFNKGHSGGVALRRGCKKLGYLGLFFIPFLPRYPFVFVGIDRELDLSLVGQVLPSLVVRSLLGYVAFLLTSLRKQMNLRGRIVMKEMSMKFLISYFYAAFQ